MLLGLGLNLNKGGFLKTPYYAVLANEFKTRVEADGGTVESLSCLKKDLKVLDPQAPPAFTGLLNDYSGAAAAYSLRLLDNTYTGDAIVVRRASDNTTQAIGFVNNELDTASLESFCSGTDGFVTTWYDQSGNGVEATQGSASSQPKIVSSGSTILKNTKPCVQFDGSDDYYYNTSGISLQDVTLINVSEYSVSGRQIQSFLRTNTGTDYISTLEYSTITSDTTQDYHTGGGTYTKNIAASVGNQYLNTSIFSSSNHALYQNGSGSTSTGGTRPLSTYNLSIGAGMNSGGSLDNRRANTKLQEIVIYPSDESTNRSGIETNINDFYTIY